MLFGTGVMAGDSAPRTLIVSPNWIGDAVMAQPLLRLLHQRNPDRPIDVLTPPAVAAVWTAMREVATVMQASFRHGALQLSERRKFAASLQPSNYDAAFVLPNTLKSALIPWMAGIPRRVGYRGEMRYGLLSEMHFDEGDAHRPMVSFYAALADPPDTVTMPGAGPKAATHRPALQATAEQIARGLAGTGLQAGRPLVVFAPGAEFGSAKRWPATHFAGLAQRLLQAFPAASIALLGSSKDKTVCQEISAVAPTVLNLAGTTSLSEAIALIAASSAVVSNDSGLLHIASALNRPVIALYGPTDPDHAPPFSDVARSMSLRLDCAPCRQRECPLGHHHCMQQLTPDLIWAELMPMLQVAAVPEMPDCFRKSMA